MYYLYLITNKVNGKVYVGQTGERSPAIRWRKHVREANGRCKHHIHKAIRFYGADNFSFTVLCWVESKKAADSLEIFYIDEFSSKDRKKGYNMTAGGDGARVLREESLKKMSQSASARWSIPENTPKYRSDVSTENIVQEYKEGKTVVGIAASLGLHSSLVFYRLKKAGVKMRGRRIEIDLESAKNMYESGSTAYEIGQVLGIDKTCVLKKLRKYGVKMRRSGARTKHGKYSKKAIDPSPCLENA